MKLHLGCGRRLLHGYINVDKAIRDGVKPDVDADIRKLPFDNNVADEVLSVHVIEHFYKWEVQDVLKEWRRVLKPDGVIVIECPDVVKAAWHMINAVISRRKIPDNMAMWPLYGDPGHRDELMCHRWGWTAETLSLELESAGFADCKEEDAQFHQGVLRDMRIIAKKVTR